MLDLSSIQVHSSVANLKGGDKQFWLRINRHEVEQYYYDYGAEAVCKRYKMAPATLERFLKRRGREERQTKLSKNDRWVYRAAMESVREVKQKVARLEEWRAEVTPVIEFGRALLNTTMDSLQSQSQKYLAKDDNLRLDNFIGKLKK